MSGDHEKSPPPTPRHCGPGTLTIRRGSPLSSARTYNPPSGPETQKPSCLPSGETRMPVTSSSRIQRQVVFKIETSITKTRLLKSRSEVKYNFLPSGDHEKSESSPTQSVRR